jgi:hypothetical protein
VIHVLCPFYGLNSLLCSWNCYCIMFPEQHVYLQRASLEIQLKINYLLLIGSMLSLWQVCAVQKRMRARTHTHTHTYARYSTTVLGCIKAHTTNKQICRIKRGVTSHGILIINFLNVSTIKITNLCKSKEFNM